MGGEGEGTEEKPDFVWYLINQAVCSSSVTKEKKNPTTGEIRFRKCEAASESKGSERTGYEGNPAFSEKWYGGSNQGIFPGGGKGQRREARRESTTRGLWGRASSHEDRGKKSVDKSSRV